MRRIRAALVLTTVVGVLAAVALILSHLALTDIAHAEPDVSAEWAVLRWSALLWAAFISSSLAAVRLAWPLTT
jgi:hypothetical protein